MSQPTIQRGSKLLGDTLTSMTIVRGTDPGFDTTVDATKTLLFVTYRSASADADSMQSFNLKRVLTDGDTITITRGLATNDGAGITVFWELWTFTDITVQHLEFGSVTALNGTIACSLAPAATSFIIDGGIAIPSGTGERTFCEWDFNTTTEVGWARGSNVGSLSGACQVVTMPNISVQVVTANLDGSVTADNDVTVTAVDLAATTIFGSMRLASTVSNDQTFTARLTSTTNLRLSRNGTVSLTTMRATIYLVTFTDGTTVQSHSVAHGAGTAVVNTTITAVDLSTSGLVLKGISSLLPIGRSTSATYGRGLATAELTTTTNLQTTKGIASSAVAYEFDVISFAGDPSVLTALEVTEESGGALGDFRVGTAKNVRIRALDQFGEVFAGFTGTVDLTATGSIISAGGGTTAAFVAGVLVHSVTFSALATGIEIDVEDSADPLILGTSAVFNVTVPPAGTGGVSLIGGASPFIS